MAGTWLHNMIISTSGNYLPAGFECAKKGVGIEKIVLGTDYPYETMSECLEFLDGLGLTESERVALFEGNARALGID
jgi:predicted TIM-barrel fold metal-dependent hydrolase